MPALALATMTALASLVAAVASGTPASSTCTPAHTSASAAALPERWRAAVTDLIRSTAEPGHPWSCVGGTIELELNANGAVLGIAREGEESVSRQVASPEDVVPLGEALLAMPLALQSQDAEHAETTPRAERVAPPPTPAPAQHDDVTASPTKNAAPTSTANKPSRRMLISAGVDSRGVGGSGVGWLGPTASAGVVLGRWLPSISLRQESAFVSHGPPISELSVAFTVQSRFDISPFELRAGLALRGAAVLRDLPRPLGQQSRLEGRLGAVTSFVIPMFDWGSLLLSADAEVVGVSRESAAPTTSTAEAAPTQFPTYTLGGNACLEIPL